MDKQKKAITTVKIDGALWRMFRMPDGSWYSKPLVDLYALFDREIRPLYSHVSVDDFAKAMRRSQPETAGELGHQPDSVPVSNEAPSGPLAFKVGDVVCLTGDGALRMTVIGVGPDCDQGDQVVTVAWTVFPGPDLKTRNLPPAALRHAAEAMAAFS